MNSSQQQPISFINYGTLASTNKHALDYAESKRPKGIVIIKAVHQTHGMGQGENQWESEAGSNITASAILSPGFLEPSRQFFISMIVSLAIIRSLQEIKLPLSLRIKWPNDIYAGENKLGGILIQHSISGNHLEYSVCGIGINVNQTTFHSDAPNPVSLRQLTGQYHDVDRLLKNLAEKLGTLYHELENNCTKSISHAYHELLFRRFEEAEYIYRSKVITAAIQGVDQYGRLELLSAGKKLVCDMKEIRFRL